MATGLPDTVAYKLLVILYVVLPYFALFILRVYVLHKAQQFRRDMIRKQESKDLQNAGEHTRLVRDRRVGDARCGGPESEGQYRRTENRRHGEQVTRHGVALTLSRRFR